MRQINQNLHLLVVAGGKGTRLWPISNPTCEKQFIHVNDDFTFIQSTTNRYLDLGLSLKNVTVIVTTESQKNHAIEQLTPMGVLEPNIKLLPPTLGYARCMGVGGQMIGKANKDAIIINTPADQYIGDSEKSHTNFIDTMKLAIRTAEDGTPTIVGVKVNDLVTFRGCGHAQYDTTDESFCKRVVGFVEKPNSDELAERMMLDDDTACNTGINVWRAKDICDAMDLVDDDMELGTDDLMGLFPELRVAIGNFIWKDCGTMKSYYEICTKTPNHLNATIGVGDYVVQRINCRGSLFYTVEGIQLYANGIRDCALVVTPYNGVIYVLIAKHEECQRIKDLVEYFNENQGLLTTDYTIAGKNNVVIDTNLGEGQLKVGIVGCSDIHLTAVKIAGKEGEIAIQATQMCTKAV